MQQAGGQLVTGARVLRIDHDARGLATGAEWIDDDGGLHFQAAEVVLLAANGMGTPRILLASDSVRFPDGMVDSSGLVGRRLMVHPLAVVKGLFREDVQGWRGHAGASIVSFRLRQRRAERFHRRGEMGLVPRGRPPFAPPSPKVESGEPNIIGTSGSASVGQPTGAWSAKTFPARTIGSSYPVGSRIALACPPRGWCIE